MVGHKACLLRSGNERSWRNSRNDTDAIVSHGQCVILGGHNRLSLESDSERTLTRIYGIVGVHIWAFVYAHTPGHLDRQTQKRHGDLLRIEHNATVKPRYACGTEDELNRPISPAPLVFPPLTCALADDPAPGIKLARTGVNRHLLALADNQLSFPPSIRDLTHVAFANAFIRQPHDTPEIIPQLRHDELHSDHLNRSQRHERPRGFGKKAGLILSIYN